VYDLRAHFVFLVLRYLGMYLSQPNCTVSGFPGLVSRVHRFQTALPHSLICIPQRYGSVADNVR
jgi:hypothetical protein